MTNSSSSNFLSQIMELRSRLIKVLITTFVIFILLLPFSNTLYNLIAHPLASQLPMGSSMIAIEVTSPFFVPIKLTAILAFFISIPYILYQIWQFIAPALYLKERRLVVPLLITSTLLFYGGILFAYFVIFPLAFHFFIHTVPDHIKIYTDINYYLSFVTWLFIAFGIAFQVPVIIVILCWSGITDIATLRSKRRYVIVAAFVIAMLMTPPDVLSQTLLAIPIYLLFEIGLIFSQFYTKKNDKEHLK